jgi:hypothetical protein
LTPARHAGSIWAGRWHEVATNEAHIFNQPRTMKKQLIRISILQSSKIATALYVLMGFIYTLIGIPMIIFGEGPIRIVGFIYLLGPIIMGVVGFLIFVVFAAVYNLLAKPLGGIEVEVKNIE